MEDNIIFKWLIYCHKPDLFCLESFHNDEVQLNCKQLLCTSTAYHSTGQYLLSDFPSNSTGFSIIFDYLSNHKGRIMDKLKSDDRSSYINNLMDLQHFSFEHHVSLIKCFMKAYVCEIAPMERILRALDALGVPVELDCNKNSSIALSTYRNIQHHLHMWLQAAACKGLTKSLKNNQSLEHSVVTRFVSNSSLGTQFLFCMIYYVDSKISKTFKSIPQIESISKNESLCSDTILEHAKLAMGAFSDLSENRDILPIQASDLTSILKDNVNVSTSIALIFHWVFGNSLKTLENIWKTDSHTSKISRPNRIVADISNISNDSKAFYISDRDANERLSKNKTSSKCSVDKKSNSDGDTSPEIFLTPTDEEPPSPFLISAPNSKLLPRHLNMTYRIPHINHENAPDVMSISLKSEFQKKLQQKQNNNKQRPKVTILNGNETTWLAQKNKNEAILIPLTPTKSARNSASLTQIDSQNLTKGQMNDLKIQLGLSRQKIQNNKRKTVEETEKTLENDKQKAFFQVVNKKMDVVRRKSFESNGQGNDIRKEYAGKRMSLFVTKDEMVNQSESVTCPIQGNKFDPFKDSVKEIDELSRKSSLVVENDYNCDRNGMELPESIRANEVLLVPTEIRNESISDIPCTPFNNDAIDAFCNVSTEPSLPEDLSESRKNSSPSISSLSSASINSSDKLQVSQDEYKKSMDFLNKSLTSLQEEIRFLCQQQSSLSLHILKGTPNKDMILDTNFEESIKSEIETPLDYLSVPETPTNNVISLTEITELSKNVIDSSISEETNNLKKSLNHVYLTEEEREPKHLVIDSIHKAQNVINFENIIQPAGNILSNSKETDDKLSNGHNELSPMENIDRSNSIEEDEKDEFDNGNGHNLMTNSFMASSTDEDYINMSPSVPPVAFEIVESQNLQPEEAQRRKAEILAKREEKRKRRLEELRQQREKEKEEHISSAVDVIMTKEEKKRMEKEKRDNVFSKYLERKQGEVPMTAVATLDRRVSSTTNTPVKSSSKANDMGVSLRLNKNDLGGNSSSANPYRNTWYGSIRKSDRASSCSTPRLNMNVVMTDSNTFGVPLPAQEYSGPKLFGKRKVKTNRSVIVNAISHCCLAGSVNESLKESVLKKLAETEGTHFMILFRDSRCQFKALYIFDLATDDLNLIFGNGPKLISHDMVEKFYKYNSGAKQFNLILSTKHLSPAVDAICIQSHLWGGKPTGPNLSGAVSISNIIQPKPKRK